MAMVRAEGIGAVWSAAYAFPVTCGEVENKFVESAMSENPVMKVAAAGLIPKFPVIDAVGTMKIPAFSSCMMRVRV
jgi:hypothetical protein